MVLIAGKGHEKYQEIGGVSLPVRRRRHGARGAGRAARAADEGLVSGVALTLPWIADAVGGDLRGVDGRPVADVVTDSRAIGSGDVFVALAGPRFDGHDFVEAAFERGAAGAVVSRQWAEGHAGVAARGSVIVVDEPLRALQALARAIRRAVATRVVAITGSAGKTTTKEADGRVLSSPRFTRGEEQGQPEQPHRPAAVADPAAPARPTSRCSSWG